MFPCFLHLWKPTDRKTEAGGRERGVEKKKKEEEEERKVREDQKKKKTQRLSNRGTS